MRRQREESHKNEGTLEAYERRGKGSVGPAERASSGRDGMMIIGRGGRGRKAPVLSARICRTNENLDRMTDFVYRNRAVSSVKTWRGGVGEL